MHKLISQYSKKIKSLNLLTSLNNEGSYKFHGIPSSANSFFSACIYESLQSSTMFAIFSSNSEAEFFYRELLSFLEPSKICFFPGIESIPYDYSRPSIEIKKDRIKVLSSLLSEKHLFIVTSVAGFLKTLPLPNVLKNKSFKLNAGSEIDPDKLIKNLSSLGYHRQELCEEFGHFSVKGGIIDIFSAFSNYPIRLDFFGDTIESIKTFDPESQKSIDSLKQAIIMPVDEFFLTQDEKELFKNKINSFDSSLKKPIHELDSDIYLEELNALIHKPCGILEYLQSEPIMIFMDSNASFEKAIQLEREYNALYEIRSKEIICLKPEELMGFKNIERKILEDRRGILISPIHSTKENEIFHIKEAESFKGKIRDVREKIIELKNTSKPNIVITSSFHAQTERLKSLFESENIIHLNPDSDEPEIITLPKKDSNVFVALSELRNGFFLADENTYFWSENDIFGRSYKRKTRFKKQASSAIQSFIDLKEGDYVVHINHGIGRFIKLEKVQADNKIRDCLKLQYAGGDTLFVPLDQISMVQKYVGGSEKPPLDSLGKVNWKKKVEKAKESVVQLAEELIIMYSNRMNLMGYAYPPDTIWQEEFEAEFEYEETPDQIAAIEAVKSDLESPKPMDRLICGDVGYGKTEVAIRAAFKVMMAGKQVLFVAPTTILALQHYNTLIERFKSFPIKLEMVSRFKTQNEIKNSMKKFAAGDIDLLIGTHSLLNESLKSKNLGLLIIDEEQRFGVTQKETIKKMKNMIDVLALSATPIPRTLHMSLAGIRDLSIIETPPKNRQSVETYVLEDNEEIIKTAIKHELERDGQVFYLFNRVEEIEQEASKLSKLLPFISIGILHGQLSEDDVEETIMDFNSRKYDVLVTTSIIESGIDMPNVNTMIVKRADTFGLSQLYQIRGRVGRSGRKAYAYLFYPASKSMSENAEKRLNTIYEYQELGSGFKVAMRDLEIRGAGNLLGLEQSGNIAEIGFDLYVNFLNEAVKKLKKEEIKIETRTLINLKTDFYLPEQYIPDTRQKIEFYKKFEGASSIEEVEDISSLMEDRFGKMPNEAQIFVMIEKIRVIASNLGFESIIEYKDEVKLRASSNFKGKPGNIIKLISENKSLSIFAGEPNVLKYKIHSTSEKQKLKELITLLSRL